MRQGFAGRCVLCASHQDSASLVRFTLVQLAVRQVVWFIFAHHFLQNCTRLNTIATAAQTPMPLLTH